jgi:parvulin-like peptidyl-prolyl isomerase
MTGLGYRQAGRRAARAGLAAILCAAGLSLRAELVVVDGVAAYVNDEAVTIGDVLAAMEPARRQLVGKLTGNDLMAKLKAAYADTLDALIDQRLILAAYAKQDLKIPENAADQRINETIHEKFDDDRSALLAALADDGLTFDDWRKEVQNQIIAATMHREFVDRRLHVPPSAVRATYDAHRARYEQPARLKLRLILVNKSEAAAPAERRARAEQALARLKGGEEFATVAGDVSEDAKAGEGGDWGWIEPGLLKPELAQAAQALERGQFSGIVETAEGFYMLKVDERQEGGVAAFETVRGRIQKELERKEAERLYTAWARRLRDEASVRIMDVNLF